MSKNKLASIPGKPLPERQTNFLSKLLDEPIGAIERWGHRGAVMRQQGLDLINQSLDPNVGQLQGLGMAGLGAAMIPASPFLSLLPSSQELRDRGRAAGGGELNQAIGGAIGDLVNIPDPATSATALATLGKAALTTKGLAAAAAHAGPVALKSMAIGPGKLGETVFRAVSKEELDAIRKTGQIKSNSSLSLPVEKHFGLTPFASTMDDTKMYADLNNGGAILEVKKTPDMRSDYVELPTLLQRRDELMKESEQLRNTISRGGAPDAAKFKQWLSDNEKDIEGLTANIKASGIPEDVIRSAPKGIRLPYLMTPNPVDASNIVKIHEATREMPAK